jgi:5'/3'-nucleotidase SurE
MPYMILITNDDGVASSGLLAAYEAVKDLGEVYVVAPATHQSAMGRSMTLFEPLRVSKLSFSDTTAYSVNGTPTDSVIIGMFVVLDRKPDLVISGINVGENLSAEATTSGTIGAALEATNQGVPAIAVSMRVEDELRNREAELAEAQHVAHIGSWIRDVADGRSAWSDEAYRIFGLTPQESALDFETMLSYGASGGQGGGHAHDL